MEKNKFRREVILKATYHGIERWAIHRALDCYAGEEVIYHKNEIQKVLQMAKAFMQYKRENKGYGLINLTPETLLSSEYICEQITPWVENIRTELFGNSNPPFKDDIDKAILWIQEKANEPLPMKEQKRREGLMQKIDEVFGLVADSQIPWIVSFNRPVLHFPGNTGYVEKVPVDHSNALSKLERAVRGMANATGFEKYALTAFILTGIEPILPRVIVKNNNKMQALPTGGNLRRFNIIFDISTKDLTFDELKEIYEAYRKHLRIKKNKSLSDKQYRIYSLVKEKGGPPRKGEKGVTAFWSDIAQQSGYSGWRQAYNCYQRILKKL